MFTLLEYDPSGADRVGLMAKPVNYTIGNDVLCIATMVTILGQPF